MIRRFMLIFAIFLTTSGATLFAQTPPPSGGLFEGTPQEQAACRPDTMKYCREFVPDSMQVLACLQRQRAKISKACQEVLSSHGQ
jgi:hypothetical protein